LRGPTGRGTRAAGGLLVWKAATCRHGRPSVAEGYGGRSRTNGLQQPKGVAIRVAWLTWLHLAASRGHDAEFVFWPRLAREDNTLGIVPGSCGWWVGSIKFSRSVRQHGYRRCLFFPARMWSIRRSRGGRRMAAFRRRAAHEGGMCWVRLA